MLYVSSYLALVTPGGHWVTFGYLDAPIYWRQNYRWGGEVAEFAFWPLNRIDRKLRPEAWLLPSDEP